MIRVYVKKTMLCSIWNMGHVHATLMLHAFVVNKETSWQNICLQLITVVTVAMHAL